MQPFYDWFNDRIENVLDFIEYHPAVFCLIVLCMVIPVPFVGYREAIRTGVMQTRYDGTFTREEKPGLFKNLKHLYEKHKLQNSQGI